MNVEIKFNEIVSRAREFYENLRFEKLTPLENKVLDGYHTIDEWKDFLDKQKEKLWAVYIISSKNEINFNDEIEEAYNNAKNNHFSMSRAPEKNAVTKEGCLYVGSSQSVYNRLKKHIGLNDKYKGEYALHLDQWLANGEFKIELYNMEPENLSKIGSDLSPELKMQLIEDIFWDIKEPLFGKKGGK